MAKLYNIGHNVGSISDLGYENGNKIDPNIAEEIKKAKHKYLMAVTANMTQQQAVATFRKHGFKQIVTFYSSHGDDETLTVWAKIQNKYQKKAPVETNSPGGNCSVIYTRQTEYIPICSLTAENPRNAQDALPKGFMRIKDTPIYFRINDKYIVGNPKLPKAIKVKKTGGIEMTAFNF